MPISIIKSTCVAETISLVIPSDACVLRPVKVSIECGRCFKMVVSYPFLVNFAFVNVSSKPFPAHRLFIVLIFTLPSGKGREERKGDFCFLMLK